MTSQNEDVRTRDDLVKLVFQLLDHNDAVPWENETSYQFLQAVAASIDSTKTAGRADSPAAVWNVVARAFGEAAKPAGQPVAKYRLPPTEILVRYLAMLRDVLLHVRLRAYDTDPQSAELLDAVENVPDLLARWPEMDGELVRGQLRDYEMKYLAGDNPFTSTLDQGPRPAWQQKWNPPE